MPANSAVLVLWKQTQDRESREFHRELMAAQETERRLRETKERLRRAAELYRERLEGARERRRSG